MIKFDFETFTKDFINESEIQAYDNYIPKIKDYLNSKPDMTGWYQIDNLFEEDLINDIKNTASFVRGNCDVFLVIGIGGSFLGALTVTEAVKEYFYNQKDKPEIYFVGTNLSSDYYNDLISLIKDKDIIVNVISKSGSTLETDVTFDLVKKLMKSKYSEEELSRRIIMTTNSSSGKLHEEALHLNCKTFDIQNNIGGRYSVFSVAGLLPIAVAGINIDNLYIGAKEAYNMFDMAFKYAFIRDIMIKKGKTVEAYVAYEPKLNALMEWLKQLYAESLGKDGKGLLPVSFINTRDLHSLGQFIQDGKKILFETVINVGTSNSNIVVDKYHKSLHELNELASISTSKAHLNGNVLNNIITLDKLDEQTIGCLLQFFMISCVISGYLEGVNPFNQDGVEAYKEIMRDGLNA